MQIFRALKVMAALRMQSFWWHKNVGERFPFYIGEQTLLATPMPTELETQNYIWLQFYSSTWKCKDELLKRKSRTTNEPAAPHVLRVCMDSPWSKKRVAHISTINRQIINGFNAITLEKFHWQFISFEYFYATLSMFNMFPQQQSFWAWHNECVGWPKVTINYILFDRN